MKFLRVDNKWLVISQFPAGLALFTLREETKKDFFGTLKKAADMGYKVVEFTGYEGIPSSEMKKALDALGLKAISTFGSVDYDFNEQIKYALAIGAKYIVVASSKETISDSSKFQTLITSLKKFGKLLKSHGLHLLYHPHDYEFEQVGTQNFIDRLLEAVGSDLLKLELDLYWVKKAGLDPKTALLKYKGLVPLVHIKDMKLNGDFTEVGHGTIDWPPIFQILKDIGVENFFVEQDQSPHPLDSVQMSLNYLRSIGVLLPEPNFKV